MPQAAAAPTIENDPFVIGEGTDKHYRVDVPNGKRGDWRIDQVTLTADDVQMFNLRALRDGTPEIVVSPGTYKRLIGPDGIMMSNTQFEYRTNRLFIEGAHGDVLVTGLGLGMILRPLLARPMVKTVTVIEKEVDVIALVLRSYRDLRQAKRLTVINADATTYTPPAGVIYDCAFHDIWDSWGDTETRRDHNLIRRAWRPYVYGHQECWTQALTDRQIRRNL